MISLLNATRLLRAQLVHVLATIAPPVAHPRQLFRRRPNPGKYSDITVGPFWLYLDMLFLSGHLAQL